jgi:GT2 family glycosyltransferase
MMLDWDHQSERVVDQPAGAALMFRTPDLTRLGGFDPGFAMYFEDVDLCRRATALLGPLLYMPSATVCHGREETAKRFRKATTFWIERSRMRYYALHEPRRSRRIVIRLVAAVTASLRGTALLVLGVIDGDETRRREHRGKAMGYALFLMSLARPGERYWRRKLLRP